MNQVPALPILSGPLPNKYVLTWHMGDCTPQKNDPVLGGSPGVPLHLLLVAEDEEALADARGHPWAGPVEEPLEAQETGHRYGKDQLTECVHGRPTLLCVGRRGGGVNSINRMI